MKNYSQNVIVVNTNGHTGGRFCRALRKKKLSPSTNIKTLCGSIVPGITEVHLPGIAIVTCTRCRAIERGGRDNGNYRVVRRAGPS